MRTYRAARAFFLLFVGSLALVTLTSTSEATTAGTSLSSPPFPPPASIARIWRAAAGLDSQSSETCFLKGEKTDGLNKICFYNCPSGEAAITISSTSLCPLNIQK
jgi:hypothetical protein